MTGMAKATGTGRRAPIVRSSRARTARRRTHSGLDHRRWVSHLRPEPPDGGRAHHPWVAGSMHEQQSAAEHPGGEDVRSSPGRSQAGKPLEGILRDPESFVRILRAVAFHQPRHQRSGVGFLPRNTHGVSQLYRHVVFPATAAVPSRVSPKRRHQIQGLRPHPHRFRHRRVLPCVSYETQV